MADVQNFKENYDKFQQINGTISAGIDSFQHNVENKLNIINDNILQQQSWYHAYTNTDKMFKTEKASMNVLQEQADELKEWKEKWSNTFESKIKTTQKADEILNRKNILRLIQLAVVFKDVVFGINKVIQTSRDLKYYQETFKNIYEKYVEPTVEQYNKNGTINTDNIVKGLYFLKDLKHKCEVKQVESQSSFITHTINAISTGLQAYATFNSISTLTGIASKGTLLFNYALGTAQTGLAVGSVVLSGIEAYNYIQYGNIIKDIEKAIGVLETYEKQLKRKK
eukprot:804539_1